MKSFIRAHWPKIIISLLVIIFLILVMNRKSIMENKITKAKIEIFKGIQDQDMDQIQSGIDSIR